MKVTIDTKNKTVNIIESISISELILFLQESLKDWEDYTFNTNITHYPTYNPFPEVKFRNHAKEILDSLK